MKLRLLRRWFTQDTTCGELFINDTFFCHTLEDRDRFLEKSPDGQMMARKIPASTAIPRGKYRVGITFSNRFKKNLPILHEVPCFTGVRIHTGNDHTNTEGCILVGEKKGLDDFIYNSRNTMERLMGRLEGAIERGESIELEIS